MCSQTIPTFICRHKDCLQEIADVRYSPEQVSPSGYRREAHYQLTCKNPTCPLYWQTFSSVTYAELDLTPYGATEHPHWAQLQARYSEAV